VQQHVKADDFDESSSHQLYPAQLRRRWQVGWTKTTAIISADECLQSLIIGHTDESQQALETYVNLALTTDQRGAPLETGLRRHPYHVHSVLNLRVSVTV